MSNVDIYYLGKIAPEYENFSDIERFNILKGVAEERISNLYFKKNTNIDYATALMIAHMLKISEKSNTTGVIESQKVGDIEEKYAVDSSFNVSSSSAALSSTTYGLELLTFINTFRKTPMLW